MATAKNIDIDIDFSEETDLIEANYQEQHPRQMPIYLKIYWREDGNPRVVAFTANRSIEGCPMDEFHGTATAFSLPSNVDASDLARWVREKLSEKIIEINNGYEEVWDGSNYVGKFVEDEEIEAMIENAPTLSGDNAGLWDVSDWLGSTTKHPNSDDTTGSIDGIGEITANTTDKEIEEMVDQIIAEADAENVVLDGNVADFIREIRDECEYWVED